MTTRTYTDERRWANTDPSLHFNEHAPREADWRKDYLKALKALDYEGAAEIRRSHALPLFGEVKEVA